MKQALVTVAGTATGALAVLVGVHVLLDLYIPAWFAVLFCSVAALIAFFFERQRAKQQKRLERSAGGQTFEHSLQALRSKVSKHLIVLTSTLQKFQQRYNSVAQVPGPPDMWIEKLQNVEIPTLHSADELGTDFAERVYSSGGKTSAEGFYSRLPHQWREVVSLDEFTKFHEHRSQLVQLANHWAYTYRNDKKRYAKLLAVFAEPSTVSVIAQVTYLEVALAERLGNHDPVTYQVPWFSLFYRVHRKFLPTHKPSRGIPRA